MKQLQNFISFLFLLSVLFQNCESGPKKNGLSIAHYPGTEIVMQEVEMKNGKKNGYAKEYFRNGKLKRLQHYVNDSLNDSSLYYHSNGQLANLQFLKNKKPHGCWKDFSPAGQLVREMNFKGGKLDGVSSEYTYRTGKLQTKIVFKGGVKDGYEEFYYPNGKPKSKVFYINGEQMSDVQEWQENGKEINYDIKFTVMENNNVLLKNTLSYIIQLSDPKPDDKVYKLYGYEKGKKPGARQQLEKTGPNTFVLEFNLNKGGFVMEQVTLAAFRKSMFGNTIMKTHSFNASANNF